MHFRSAIFIALHAYYKKQGLKMNRDIKYKKRLRTTKMYTPFFLSDLISNMDHMRISGTEP